MNALYNFAVGPLAWIAFTVCIGGMIWRLVARTPRPPARRLGPRLHELERLADVDHPLDAALLHLRLAREPAADRGELRAAHRHPARRAVLLGPQRHVGLQFRFSFLPCPTALWTPSP
ncbi:MAG: hypothetical protein ACLR7Z_08775 [Bilophila wadsworthia]